MPKCTAKPEIVLVLRTCYADGSSHGGFRWPESGPVNCADWRATPKCGNGLHGLLWGEGDGSLLDWSSNARWLVVAVDANEIVDLESKVKFPAGEVVFSGDRLGATDYIATHGGAGRAIAGGTATAGDCGTATAGYSGTATAGYSGTATAGYSGTATAGDSGTATAGYSGTATAGRYGTATAGDCGTATAGRYGTATAGYNGTIQIARWDGKRYRIVTGYVGEDGIKPDTAYRLDAGQFVEVEIPLAQ